MAIKQKIELTGFDPLAWMDDDSPEQDVPSELEAFVEVKKEPEILNTDAATRTEESTTVERKASIEPIPQEVEPVKDSKIILDETLNIQKVNALYSQFLKVLESQETIEIDASAVVSIDTSALQLLTVLKKTGTKLHKEIVIDFPSDKFIEAAKLLGLAELLEVDHAAAGFF